PGRGDPGGAADVALLLFPRCPDVCPDAGGDGRLHGAVVAGDPPARAGGRGRTDGEPVVVRAGSPGEGAAAAQRVRILSTCARGRHRRPRRCPDHRPAPRPDPCVSPTPPRRPASPPPPAAARS